MSNIYIIETGVEIVEWAGNALYDYQSLAAGLLAIGAAWIAARPVWRQLRDTRLQSAIAQRETLVRIKKEGEVRFARVHGELVEPLSNLGRSTTDPVGDMIEIGPPDAFGIFGQLQGKLDWYLETLKGTESPEIEQAKDALREKLSALLTSLNDAHWFEHNEQHDEYHSFSDEQWEEIKQRYVEAPARVYALGGDFRRALTELRGVQDSWLEMLRSLIAKLDQRIVDETH